ncbi:MAG: ABC transporter ATP-binding protein [Bacteroidales bacterium]|nr:ABC transporter ATP-binding protein [Bacteroidales bacterium]
MKEFLKVLRRFVPPYKHYLFLNIFFNLFSAVVSLFAFGTIIPILQTLFGINEKVSDYIPFSDVSYSLKEKILSQINWYISSLIDEKGAPFTLMILGVVLIVMTFIKTGSSYLGSYFLIPIRTGVVRDIRNTIYKKILNLPMGFFSGERKGDVMARMTGDVSEVENSIMASLDMLFKNPILIIVNLVTLFLISWQLTLFVLVLLPVSGYIMGNIGRKLKRSSKEGQDQYGVIMSQMEETLGGLRIIKAFLAERKVSGRFESATNKFMRITNRIARRQALAHPMSEFLGTVTIAVLLWFGGTLILSGKGSLDAATFIYYLTIFYSIINPAKDFSKASYSVQRGLAAMERVDKILSAKNEIEQKKNPVALKSVGDSIEFRNAWFKYDQNWVLKDINLSIKKGETVALVGQSGSGKSTMADMLPRFYDIQKGEILIDGINIKDVAVYDLRNIMGNVNQEAILFNDTFFNNITFGVESATLEQVREAARIANADEFIMATDGAYEANIGDRGCKLSGGQRQRISIARAILKNPPVLILDEATSALDTESERLVQEALEHLMKNRTTLVIAHRLSTIKNADMICVMHDGEIVERGRHDELIKLDGYYKRLVNMQSF